MAEFVPDIAYLEHFITTSAGDRRKDHAIASQKALTIPFTFDEINEANLMKYFLGTDMSTVSAATPVFSVMTSTLDYGSAQLYFRTDIGNDFIFFIPKCTIRPEGNLSMDIESWWQTGMVLDIFYYAWTASNIGGGETYYGCLSTKSIS